MPFLHGVTRFLKKSLNILPTKHTKWREGETASNFWLLIFLGAP
jgi:hypothetical protein